MRFSVGLPQTDAALLARFAARAEELGFTGLWTLDSAVASATAHNPTLDAAQTLAHVAAVTESARLGIAVIVVPRRNAVLLAKEMASLDVLSGGRLTVGLGVGSANPPGYGFRDAPRARMLTEAIGVMRALWTGEGYDGALYSFPPTPLQPKPVQRPHPPLWVGAGVPAALRRAARLADGWIGAGSGTLADFPGQVRTLQAALEEAGRDPAAFPTSKRVYIAVEDTRERARERLAAVLDPMYNWPGMTERCAVCGPREHCVEQLRGLIDAGAGELLLHPLYDALDQLEALAGVAADLRG